MEIIHVSAECYPVAKAGGLGDVVGALPKYQNKAGQIAKVVMPMYKTKFLYDNEWVVDFKGDAYLGKRYFDFTVIKEKTNKLGYDLYLIDINGLTDREKIYGYSDDNERFAAFQIAFLTWLNQWQHLPNVVHCHDHHTGLIPFMMKYCYDFQRLASVPSVFTIHNGQYQGWIGWNHKEYIPKWDSWKGGMLEWRNTINPMASAVKCAWRVTTVSDSYLDELRYNSNGLEDLFEYERGKCSGILNGIDFDVWNPKTDSFLQHQYTAKTVASGKKKNKEIICKEYHLNPDKPLFIFIGRLVGEKAADILPDALKTAMYYRKEEANYLILGTGDPHVEWQLNEMRYHYRGQYNAVIGYNEALSHLLYAGADFLLMPSRVEPCGLNQMYALRYGTMPLVRSTGGLQDTVTDMGDENGFGIRFNHASVDDLNYSIGRAIDVYADTKRMNELRKRMMEIDHSWENTVAAYTNLYQSLRYF